MAQLLITLDRGVEVTPGAARAEAAGGSDFPPGLVELVVVPLLVNVASTVAYDLGAPS